jgi:Na+/H+ antiporter NhaD/arsenite permease-like protein
MILFGILDQHTAFGAVDWNVIFLLLGMMAIAHLLSETGLFQWIAIQAVRLGRGRPVYIMMILSLVTAVGSAFLDNVTIVVLIAPVTLFAATRLGMSPIPFLIAEVLASNIGGAATLIGDPPNILIGSASGYDFLRFLANMGPISLLILIVFIAIIPLLFKKELAKYEIGEFDVEALDSSKLITKPKLLAQSLIVMSLVVVGFLVHGFLHLEPATIALAGATVLMLWTRSEPHDVFQSVEWSTLMFFFGLFMLVEGIVQVGLIERVANGALALTGGSLTYTSLLILWMSAFLSAIVDNIPYTATMIPVVKSLGQNMKKY